MATDDPPDEVDIRQRIDKLAGAIGALDLAAVMSIYAAERC